MLGKKKTLAEVVLELGLYPTSLSAKNAPNTMRIYIVDIHEKDKKIDVLIMVDNKFIGYHTLKTNWSLQVCDMQKEDIFEVYKYFNGKKTYNLSLVDADVLNLEYKDKKRSLIRVGSRNEREKVISGQKRIKSKSNGITYNHQQHKQLINFIINNNSPRQKTS